MSIKALFDQIINNNYETLRSWNSVKKDYNLIKKVRNLLAVISGNHVIEMLRDVLNPTEIENVSINHFNTLKNISSFYNINDKTVKMRSGLFNCLKNLSYKNAKEIGFKISKKKWYAQALTNESIGSKKISDDLIFSIQSHLEGLSSLAANRTIIKRNGKKKEVVNVRYMSISFSDAYIQFPDRNKLSKSCFNSYIGSEFKKPHRNSDLCDHCEMGKEIKKQIISKIIRLDYSNELSYSFDPDDLNIYIKNAIKNNPANSETKIFSEKDVIKLNLQKSVLSEIADYQEIKYHSENAKRQRLTYNQNRSDKNLLENSLLIEIDFKQKVVIGMGPDQPSRDYYEQVTRTLFGIGIYYLDKKTDEIKNINVDIVSEMSTTGLCAVQCLKFLREQQFFKDIDKFKYCVWCDTGPHFRNSTIAYYFFKELVNEPIPIVVNLNFFVEKHGKNNLDAHFSVINGFIKRASFRMKLYSTEDVVLSINEGQADSNCYREEVLGLKPIKVIALAYPTRKMNISFSKLVITDISMYYNLQNVLIQEESGSTLIESFQEVFKIQSSIYSGLLHLKEVFITDEVKAKKSLGPEKEIKVKDNPPLFTELVKRNNFLRYLVRAPIKSIILNENEVVFRDKPEICLDSCKKCIVPCRYTVIELSQKNTKINQNKIREELSSHNHCKTRIIRKGNKKIQATTEQQRDELIAHLTYIHPEAFES